jgi:hypothetical protein
VTLRLFLELLRERRLIRITSGTTPTSNFASAWNQRIGQALAAVGGQLLDAHERADAADLQARTREQVLDVAGQRQAVGVVNRFDARVGHQKLPFLPHTH